MNTAARKLAIMAGVAVFTFLLGGCLKFSLGDPEKSQVNPALLGDWFKRGDDGAVTIWHCGQYDARTYLVMQYQARPDGNGGWDRGGLAVCKMWLTEVAGQQFGCMQLLSEESDKPYVVFKYQLSGESVTVQGVNGDFVDKQNPADAAAFAAVIEKNVDNKEMFIDSEKFDKASDADKETVEAIRKAFH